MKRIYPILIAAAIFISCNNNGKGKKDPGADSAAIIAEQKKKAADENEKVLNGLEKMTPLSDEELKALMPTCSGEGRMGEISVSSSLGASVVTAECLSNDSSTLTTSIYDCAGPAGAGLYNLQYSGLLDYNTDNPTEYTKVIDFKGGKAIEHCKKETVECSFTFFTGGRFLVVLESKNMGIELLKALANAF